MSFPRRFSPSFSPQKARAKKSHVMSFRRHLLGNALSSRGVSFVSSSSSPSLSQWHTTTTSRFWAASFRGVFVSTRFDDEDETVGGGGCRHATTMRFERWVSPKHHRALTTTRKKTRPPPPPPTTTNATSTTQSRRTLSSRATTRADDDGTKTKTKQ